MRELREWRKARKMTQVELAALLGVSPSAVHQWEADHAKPSKICGRLIDRLLTSEDPTPSIVPPEAEAQSGPCAGRVVSFTKD